MPHLNGDDQQLNEQIIARAAVDVPYRKRLLETPREAIYEVSGATLPSNFRIKFIEKGPDVDALVVLPDVIDETAELDAEELEAVAGGAALCWTTCNNSCTTTNTCNGVTNVEVGISPRSA